MYVSCQSVYVLCHLVALMYFYSVLTVDGNWGEWSSWSECLCPDMKVNRTRYCDNPPPKNDGEECPGIGWEEGDCYMPCGKIYKIITQVVHLKPVFSLCNYLKTN